MSHETSAHPDSDGPAAPREDDATMTEWSGDFAPLEAHRQYTDAQGNKPVLDRASNWDSLGAYPRSYIVYLLS